MIITQDQGDKLFRFLGYGNLKAPFWFIGMEEGTSGEDEIEGNLDIRIRLFDDVMDLHIAHDSQHLNWPICEQSKYPSVWVFMAKIIVALKGEPDWADSQKAKTYICKHLGRGQNETFLTEMLPLPKSSATDWPPIYKTLYKTREEYEEIIRPRRAEMLRQQIQSYHPRFVFCYGETHYQHFKTIANVSRDQWTTLGETKIQVSKSDMTTFVLTTFLGNGRIGSNALQTLFNYLKQ